MPEEIQETTASEESSNPNPEVTVDPGPVDPDKVDPAKTEPVETSDSVEDSAKPPENSTPAASSEASEEDDLMVDEEKAEEPDLEMEAMIESSLEIPEQGSIIEGTVLAITNEDVMVAIGGKSEGIVPLSEFVQDQSVTPLELGQTYDLVYKGFQGGQPVLSRREARQRIGEAKVRSAFESGEPIMTHALRRTKGGLKVEAEGMPGFLPFSHTGVRRGQEADIEALIGQTFPAVVVEAPSGKDKDLVVSRRLLLEKEAAAAREKALDRIQVGDTVQGKVKHLTHFGAFVEMGGLDGLLHVKDMSWGHVDKPEDVVQVGEEIETVVLSIEGEKVALGLKQKTQDPWDTVEQKYAAGTPTKYEGTVTSLAPYGAFVMLEPGVEGLIHISEMSWTKRLKHPSEVLKKGDRVEVVVLSIDMKKKRVALGYKQTTEDPWKDITEHHGEGSTVTGTVVSLTNYGAFVSLGDGVDGMIHVSDLTWGKKVNHPSQVLKEGDVVEAKVLKIDHANRKISLGMKQVKPNPWQEAPAKYPEGTVVKAVVNNLTDFGAFAEIEPGLDGLIHVSEISSERVERPSDALSVGQEVVAAITKIDVKGRKIGLSIRAAEERVPMMELAEDQEASTDEPEPMSDFGQLLNAALEKGKPEED